MIDLRTEDLVRLRGEASGRALIRACESIIGTCCIAIMSAKGSLAEAIAIEYQDRFKVDKEQPLYSPSTISLSGSDSSC